MNDFTSQPMHEPAALTPDYLPDLLNRLEGRHPVLLFGHHNSGKTLAILSLFHYARRGSNADFTVSVGSDILPDTAPGAKERNDFAHGFFKRTVEDLMHRKSVAPTQIPSGQPIYFPIDVTAPAQVRQDLATVRFAILDGMGEWFAHDPSSTRGRNKPLPAEIEYILRYFSDPISVIFVVPATGSEHSPEQSKMHSAVESTIGQYQDLRQMHPGDNLLLLATMWDKLHPPNRPGGEFAEASPQVVIKSLEHIGLAWQAFRTMRNVPDQSRSLMQFSAAWISNGVIMQPHAHAVPIFERYSRTLWNWLFGNARQATNKNLRVREVLFDDVEAPKLRQPGVLERTVCSLVGVDTRHGV